MNYYNELEPYAAQWLRNLINAGLIPAGDVDTRSITDVQPSDLAGYRQCHFFAGIGGWSLAARLAGWPDDRELWTGSAPCQPFSVAGKGKAQADDRHLWPHLFRLARARRPAVLMGEQVAAAIGKDWIDGVFTDLEGIGYACGASVVPACAVDAPHRRDRLWFVAHANNPGSQGLAGHVLRSSEGWCEQAGSAAEAGLLDRAELAGAAVADADMQQRSVSLPRRSDEEDSTERREGDSPIAGHGSDLAGHVAHANCGGWPPRAYHQAAGHGEAAAAARWRSAWGSVGGIVGHDGKTRRIEPSIRLLAHGVPARVGRLRAYGNAIVPQVAAEVIGAYMDCYPEIAA